MKKLSLVLATALLTACANGTPSGTSSPSPSSQPSSAVSETPGAPSTPASSQAKATLIVGGRSIPVGAMTSGNSSIASVSTFFTFTFGDQAKTDVAYINVRGSVNVHIPPNSATTSNINSFDGDLLFGEYGTKLKSLDVSRSGNGGRTLTITSKGTTMDMKVTGTIEVPAKVVVGTKDEEVVPFELTLTGLPAPATK